MNNESCIQTIELLRNLALNIHGVIDVVDDRNCNDIIALLKEQEAVEPKVEKAILDYQSWHYICGDCGGQIDIQDNYCRHCGRVVAHLSNKI